MEDKIFLLVKVTIKTTHSNIHDAIQELHTNTVLQVSSTPNLEVLQTKIRTQYKKLKSWHIK